MSVNTANNTGACTVAFHPIKTINDPLFLKMLFLVPQPRLNKEKRRGPY
jgi:hypothetical protein